MQQDHVSRLTSELGEVREKISETQARQVKMNGTLEETQKQVEAGMISQSELKKLSGEVSVKIMPCRIFGRKAFILTPYRDNNVDNYDKRVLEIATDVKLRDVYHLEDGDVVQIEVQ